MTSELDKQKMKDFKWLKSIRTLHKNGYICDEDCHRIMEYFYARPKPSVKWPGKLDGNPEINGDDGNSYNVGWDNAIIACQAAVAAAWLEYGLDEEKVGNLLVNLRFNQETENDAEFVSSNTLRKYAHAIKLAERELIVRKEK